MKYISEFRDKELAGKISRRINDILKENTEEITLMEVCGTHTHSIFSSGVMNLLPDCVKHLSGPGCPVCVTPNSYLDRAIAYSRLPESIIATFGDMIKVPGSTSSLEKERSDGADIRVVYSPLESLRIALENPDKNVIFLGIGFETTAPLVAATIQKASEDDINNFFVLSGHKLIPPAMIALLQNDELNISGFICPGHVSTIIGEKPYYPIAEKHGIPSVITGFEPLDILQGFWLLIKQVVGDENARVENQYTRAVRKEGNRTALKRIKEVFKTGDSEWRGLGVIPKTGLFIREEYSAFNALQNIGVKVEETKEHPGCICGAILRGVKKPPECELFRKNCNPENPLGPCMVSSEGTCAAYYKYGKE